MNKEKRKITKHSFRAYFDCWYLDDEIFLPTLIPKAPRRLQREYVEWLLKTGKYFTSRLQGRPRKNLLRGIKIKRCYFNSQHCLYCNDDYKYYEGFYISKTSPFGVHNHAFLVYKGKVIDPTLRIATNFWQKASNADIEEAYAEMKHDLGKCISLKKIKERRNNGYTKASLYFGVHIPTAFIRKQFRCWGNTLLFRYYLSMKLK